MFYYFFLYFCKTKLLIIEKNKTMAIAIREIPVLTGQSAIDFMEEADKYSGRPVPHLSSQREAELRRIREAHKHFIW